MNTVRLNITLPEELVCQIDKLVKPGQKSSFIAETLKERIERIQSKKLQQMLEEGYKARNSESRSLAEEFRHHNHFANNCKWR
jgi:metal-responsive CopG/Arc/MetJ family transcriptional regulator